MIGRGKSWAEISERRLVDNFKEVQRVAGPDVAVLSVVKADAYGHGAVICSDVLARAGTAWLGVTDVAEGAAVQDALSAPSGPSASILILCGFLPEDAAAIVQRGLVPVLWTPEQLQWLASAATQSGRTAPLGVHLEIDTGMSRQGVTPGPELARMLDDLLQHRDSFRLDGVLTHFASAEVVASVQTREQRRQFEAALQQIRAGGLTPTWIHAGNSSGADNPEGVRDEAAHTDWLRDVAGRSGAKAMVRAGLALYGHTLPLAEDRDAPSPIRQLHLAAAASDSHETGSPVAAALRGLAPVATWKTRVLAISQVQAGTQVGYNATFRAARAMRLALLPVGYADGLRRELSGSSSLCEEADGGWVVIREARAQIVGRISMNLTTVDVTEIDGVAPGDEVTLLGPGVSASVHAHLAETIPYEILCGMRPCTRVLIP